MIYRAFKFNERSTSTKQIHIRIKKYSFPHMTPVEIFHLELLLRGHQKSKSLEENLMEFFMCRLELMITS